MFLTIKPVCVYSILPCHGSSKQLKKQGELKDGKQSREELPFKLFALGRRWGRDLTPETQGP